MVDEVEDGGRAQVIEEGIAAYVFDYAKRHAYLDGVAALDYALLRTIKDLTKKINDANATIHATPSDPPTGAIPSGTAGSGTSGHSSWPSCCSALAACSPCTRASRS